MKMLTNAFVAVFVFASLITNAQSKSTGSNQRTAIPPKVPTLQEEIENFRKKNPEIKDLTLGPGNDTFN